MSTHHRECIMDQRQGNKRRADEAIDYRYQKFSLVHETKCEQLKEVCKLDVQHDFSELAMNTFYRQFFIDHPSRLPKVSQVEDFLLETVYKLKSDPQPLQHYIDDPRELEKQSFTISTPSLYDEEFKTWLAAIVYSRTNQIKMMTDTTLLSRETVCELASEGSTGHFNHNAATSFDRGTSIQDDPCNVKIPMDIAITRTDDEIADLAGFDKQSCLLSFLDYIGVTRDDHLIYKIPGLEVRRFSIPGYVEQLRETYLTEGKKLPYYIKVIMSLVQRRNVAVDIEPLLVDLQRKYNINDDLIEGIRRENKRLPASERLASMTLVKTLFDIKGAGDRLQIVACPEDVVFATNDRMSVVLGHILNKRVIRTFKQTAPYVSKVLSFHNMGSADIGMHVHQALVNRLNSSKVYLQGLRGTYLARATVDERARLLEPIIGNEKLDQLRNMIAHISNIYSLQNGRYIQIGQFEVQRLYLGLIVSIIDKYISICTNMLPAIPQLAQLLATFENGAATEDEVMQLKTTVTQVYSPSLIPIACYSERFVQTLTVFLANLEIPEHRFDDYIQADIQLDIDEFSTFMSMFNETSFPLVSFLPWIANLYEASAGIGYKFLAPTFQYRKQQADAQVDIQRGQQQAQGTAKATYYSSSYLKRLTDTCNSLEDMGVLEFADNTYATVIDSVNIQGMVLYGGVDPVTVNAPVQAKQVSKKIAPQGNAINSARLLPPPSSISLQNKLESQRRSLRALSVKGQPPKYHYGFDKGPSPRKYNAYPIRDDKLAKALKRCYESLMIQRDRVNDTRKQLEEKLPEWIVTAFRDMHPDKDPLIEVILTFFAKMEAEYLAGMIMDVYTSSM